MLKSPQLRIFKPLATINQKKLNIQKPNIEIIKDTISIQNLNEKVSFLSNKIEHIQSEITKPGNDELFGFAVTYWKVFIAVFIPILLFGLGNFVAWFKKKSEKRSLTKSKIKVLLSWIDLMEKTIKSQTESNNNYCEKLKKIKIIHPVEIDFYNILANKLNTSNLFDFTEILVSNQKGKDNEKRKDLFNTISQIDFLIDIEKKLRSTYNNQKEEIIFLMEKWNKQLKEIHTCILNDRKDPNTDNSLFKEYQRLSHNINKKYPDRINELEIIISNLIEPFRDFTNTKPENIYSSRLIITLTEMFSISKQFISYREGYAHQIKRITDEMNNSYNVLKSSAANIEKRKIVSVWRIK